MAVWNGLTGQDEGLEYRRRFRGLIGVHSKVPIRDRAILSLIYTPGVAEACLAISQDPLASYDLTCRGNTVALLTDGSDLFGREGGPPESAIPVAEAKSVIFKTFAGIDAFPICLATRDPQEIVQVGTAITPTFGAICLDDISTPRAFTVADHLEKAADIPIFSNQHHGTAILVLGALINALKIVKKEMSEVSVVISGAGIAGIGVARLLVRAGVKNLVVCDRAGAIYKYRPERMNWAKAYVAKETNPEGRRGSLAAMLKGADVFIGLSTGNIVTDDMIRSMAHDPIVFALAIPEPEIDPAAARAGGARVVATGRSDYANQMDVSLVFPGFFRGLLDARARNIRLRMLIYAAQALADMVKPDELHPDHIVPSIFDFRVAPAIAAAVVRAALGPGDLSPSRGGAHPTLCLRGPLAAAGAHPARRAEDVPRRSDRASTTAWRSAGDPLQAADPRPAHPELDVRPAGRAPARPRHPRRSVASHGADEQGQSGRDRDRWLVRAWIG